MKRRTNNVLVTALIIMILLLVALIAGMLWFVNSHIFIEGVPYPKKAEYLNLRDQELTFEEYEQIRQQFPDAEIFWNVPIHGGGAPNEVAVLQMNAVSADDVPKLAYFGNLAKLILETCPEYDVLLQIRQQYPQLQLQYTVSIGGKDYPQDAATVTVSELTDADIENMWYLTELKKVDARACQDTARLAALQQAHPNLEVSYEIQLLGQSFTEDTTTATFRSPDMGVLLENLGGLSNLETVHLVEPNCDAVLLEQLVEKCPHINITWEKTVLGKTFSSTDTEFDFSGMELSGTDPVEAAMRYFPNAEKVIMSHCGIDNETMAAFREKMRPEYKVVWTVIVTKREVRTDQTVFHSSGLKVCLIDEQSNDLFYCEDMIVVDIGHSYVKYIEWVKGMPNLQYLIIADNWIKDLTPISTCKNLVYLELFMNKHIKDYSPLLGCTALQDLNISGTYADPEPLHEMTWLNNLWANMCGLTSAERTALANALPDTVVQFSGSYTSNGWRDLENYFKMRDIMGLNYNAW